MASVEIPLNTTNPQTLGALCLLLVELTRACQHEVYRLGGGEQALALKQKLIKIIAESKVLQGLPEDQMKDVRKTASGIIENIIRFQDASGRDVG
jgi:hypothetical protein